MSKAGKAISIIVGIIVIGLIVQWSRFYSKVSKLGSEMGLHLPASYFPFNGTYIKTKDGSVSKG